MNRTIGLVAAATGLIIGLSSALAGSATWLANPGNGDWSTATNWTPGGPPNDPADTATFDSSAISNILLSGSVHVNRIAFNSGVVTPYTISAFTLGIFGLGITNDSATTQNFVARANGEIYFGGNASAGSNTAFTMGGDAGDAGFMEFFNSSTADHAVLTINGSNHLGWGGGVAFNETSSAGNATIIVNGSAFQHCPTGKYSIDIDPCFDNPYPQGVLFVYSTVANATLIANGGIGDGDGGCILFQSRSTVGTARVKVFGNGNLDISNHNDPGVPGNGVTIGSLEGNGVVFLGGNNLTIGSNNLTTTFSGVVRYGSPFGGSSGGSLTKIGTGTLTLSGMNTYDEATTVNAGRLIVDGAIVSPVTVNNGGTLGGSGSTHGVTVNSGGIVAPGEMQALHIVGNYIQHAGGVLKLSVSGTDPSTSDHLDILLNATLDGTLEVRFVNGFLPLSGQVFKILHANSDVSGSFSQIIFPDLRAGFQFQTEVVNGYYQITALTDGVPATGFLNISTRMRVGTGDNALIGGFIITGIASKKVIIRAIGPSLAPLPGRLADPMLELRDSAGGLIFSNDNWVESPQTQQIIDSGLPPGNDHEAAIVATLAPGSYTAVMRGAGNTTGIGVVEVYDLAQEVSARLANISSRGFVETGDNVMIGGFIAGNQAMHVMVRAIGPSLAQFGIVNALADPTLELHNSNGAVIAFNNDWRDNDQVAIEATGIPPSNIKESAIVAILAPGPYTAIVRGLNDTTGVGLVEVYNLQ